MITLFTFNVLGQSDDVKTLMENRETREEVFSTILNDHNLMMEFMDQMSGNAHAMAMMRGNREMMMNFKDDSHTQSRSMGSGHGNMMGMTSDNSESIQKMGHLMDRCKADSTVCMELTNVIARHPDMMRMMMRMMHREGLIEPDPEQLDHPSGY